MKVLLILLATATLSSAAMADQAWLSNLAFGPSVPQNDSTNRILNQNTSYDPGGQPTRYGGGEKITIQFQDPAGKKATPLPIESIRLIGFSKSGGGAVMVRALNSKPAQTPHFFDPLTLFSAIAADQKAQGKDGKVMVGAGDSVFLQFAQLITFDSLEFILESFGDDDASIDIQFIWHGDNPKATQLITRRILNPPVYHSGGGNSSGSGNENTCQASVQCRGLEHCMDGQCIDVNRQPCATSGAHTCGPGESCCQGRCDSGSCH